MSNTIPDDAGWLLDEYDGERFWAHVNFHGGNDYLDDPLCNLPASAGECWVWPGVAEYGLFEMNRKWQRAHRIGLREFNVKIPEGYSVDHLCRNTRCVRWNHLEPVTHQVNVARGLRGHVTHCPSGHEYTEENTKVEHRRGKTHRVCRICLAASRHRSYLRSKQK